MSQSPSHQPSPGPRREEGMSAGGFVARVLGGWVVDALVNGAVLLSLVTGIAGFLTGEPGLLALGVVVGLLGMASPWYAVFRKWGDRRVLPIVAVVIVVDLASLTLMWTTTRG